MEAQCSVNCRDCSGASPIVQAVATPDQQLCELLLARAADPDAVDVTDGSPILHLALQAGNRPLLQALFDIRANIHAKHPRNGRTLLHTAACLRMAPLARQLLSVRAEIDAQCHVGDTALRLAVQGRHVEVAEVLCHARADPNCPNRSGCAPIHAAAALGDMRLLQLLSHHMADPNLVDRRKWSPLHYVAASGRGSGQAVQSLMAVMASPSARSYQGRTPMQLYAMGTANERLGSAGNPLRLPAHAHGVAASDKLKSQQWDVSSTCASLSARTSLRHPDSFSLLLQPSVSTSSSWFEENSRLNAMLLPPLAQNKRGRAASVFSEGSTKGGSVQVSRRNSLAPTGGGQFSRRGSMAAVG